MDFLNNEKKEMNNQKGVLYYANPHIFKERENEMITWNPREDQRLDIIGGKEMGKCYEKSAKPFIAEEQYNAGRRPN